MAVRVQDPVSDPGGRPDPGRPGTAAVRRLGKAGLRRFGIITAASRSLPDFLIVGTKRGGTTSLHRYLLAHPRVLPLFPSAERLPMRANLKGVHYFDSGFHQGTAWYRSHFPSTACRQLMARRCGGPVLAGEATPYYLYHPDAPLRAGLVAPKARVIVLLRNPVDRAFSHWKEQRRRGYEPLASFEDALDAEAGRLDGEEERLRRDPSYRSFSHEHQSYAQQGRYLGSLDRWMRTYPAGQVHVVRSEDLFTDPQRTYDDVLSFLDLPPFRMPDPSPFNVTLDACLPDRVRRRLEASFGPDNRALEDRLGRSFGWGSR
ncbi:MAG: sulfotransferase [Actinomycetota bacterium]|nr:sulfotransferase [Actinomycetota bacterium]